MFRPSDTTGVQPYWIEQYPVYGPDSNRGDTLDVIMLTAKLVEMEKKLAEAEERLKKYEKEDAKKLEILFARYIETQHSGHPCLLGVRYEPSSHSFFVYTTAEFKDKVTSYRAPDSLRECKVTYVLVTRVEPRPVPRAGGVDINTGLNPNDLSVCADKD